MKKFVAIAVLLALFACSGKRQEIRPDWRTFNVEQSFDKANKLIDKKDYDKARELLLEVKSRDRSGNYAPLAQLRIADAFYAQEEWDSSISEYKKFLDAYPDNKYASYAQYQIGMIYFNQIVDVERGYGAAEKALSEFENLKQLYPRNPYKSIVEMRINKCRDILAGYEFMVGEFYFNKQDMEVRRYYRYQYSFFPSA